MVKWARLLDDTARHWWDLYVCAGFIGMSELNVVGVPTPDHIPFVLRPGVLDVDPDQFAPASSLRIALLCRTDTIFLSMTIRAIGSACRHHAHFAQKLLHTCQQAPFARAMRLRPGSVFFQPVFICIVLWLQYVKRAVSRHNAQPGFGKTRCLEIRCFPQIAT